MLTILKNKYLNIAYLRIHPQIHRGIPRFNQDPITQVMKFKSPDLGFPPESLWNYGKI